MSSSIDDRQKAFESRFKVDEELRFKVQSRATKLFGAWAAGKLGITGEAEVAAYANEVLDADFDEPGIQDVLRKVQQDFKAKGIDMDLHHLENEYNVHLNAAKQAIMAA